MSATTTSHVTTVRRFNRFYTSQIGVLREGHLSSPFTLTEVRILYEIAHREAPMAKDLAADLAIDPGYLSRILLRLKKRRLVVQKSSKTDARRRPLALTRTGERTFVDLDARARGEVHRLLEKVSAADRPRLTQAMQMIESLLGSRSEPANAYVLRSPRPGDLGWIVQRHGEIYHQEYGWNEQFEGMVAKIAAELIERFDPRLERVWIAERSGERVGSVALVKKSATIAQLRLLLVEPSARGLGIGKRLVEECEQFARQVGYRKIRLWTQSVLHAARHIYQRAGYQLVSEDPSHGFGADMVAQVWERTL
jgi:DNA-binding MarR family transcriptional regulator/GNAT superfamily N-acetyltransferase